MAVRVAVRIPSAQPQSSGINQSEGAVAILESTAILYWLSTPSMEQLVRLEALSGLTFDPLECLDLNLQCRTFVSSNWQ